LGTVDVYFHTTNPDPQLNAVTPHQGVAWVRREDLSTAFEGLVRLGRIPRLVFQDALFPAAFQQQIVLMGLTLEDNRAVMGYRPLYGPDLPDEVGLGRLPHSFAPEVTTTVAATQADLAVWLRVFRAGYYNTEALTVEPEIVGPLMATVERGEKLFVTATYQQAPLGAARVGMRASTAQLEVVVTAPLWHGMGLEEALVATAVTEAIRRGAGHVFTVAPTEELSRLYRRVGFVDLTRVLTFWRGTPPPPPGPAVESVEGEP
jgi:GNAT superfamily N-acetyltransferase